MTARVAIRRLAPDEAEAYRAVRLAALADRPASFGSSVEEEAARPLAEFRDRIAVPAPAGVFGAFAGASLAGMARFTLEAGVKKRHIGWMTGVAVLPEYRGQGIARALVGHVVAHARGCALVLRASVETTNAGARRLYASAGFRSIGVEPRSLRIADRFYDEDHLVLDLDT
ncbi:MAG: GNAT family N-acetyltransferase [Alsobacter sp.]